MDSRERVLNAAEALFLERGYNAVSMHDIARQLGIKAASLYYHFPGGKEELFATVNEELFARHGEGLHRAAAEGGSTLRERLMAITRWFASQRPLHLMAMLRSDMPAIEEETQHRIEAALETHLFAPIADLFREAAHTGEIRPVHAETITGLYLTFIDGMAWTLEEVEQAPPAEVMAGEVVSILLDGLHPRP